MKRQYCTKCGNRRKVDEISHLCNDCRKESNKQFKEEEREDKRIDRECKNRIKTEFKVHDKLRELEKIFKRPCWIEINIANAGIYIFGRWVKRRFIVKPLTRIKAISQLKGKYDDIDEFKGKAERLGFETYSDSAVEVTLKHNGKRYDFTSRGIFKDEDRIGIFARLYGEKVADVEFELWRQR